MFTLAFLKSAGERAVKTFAQTVLALVTVGPLVGVTHLDWPSLGGLGATAAVISVLTSVTSLSSVGSSTATPAAPFDATHVIFPSSVPSGIVPDLPSVDHAPPVIVQDSAPDVVPAQ